MTRPVWVAGVACLVAFGLLAVAVAAAEPFLEWLDISPENFQLAAGVIMLPQALQLLWRGRTLGDIPGGAVIPLAIPLLAGPASTAAAMSYGARFGEPETAAAAAAVLAATAGLFVVGGQLQDRTARLGLEVMGRFNGALLAVVAVEMVVDGVRSV